MAGAAEVINLEIRALRKGRGIYAGNLEHRLGPQLEELVATAVSPAATLRQTLTNELTECAARLADDVRTAITASLGLSGPTRQLPLFRDRLAWLAGELGRDERTALRRIGDAELLLAEEIAGELVRRRGPVAPHSWHLEELRTLLRLDTPTPESHEHRRIVATRDGLAEVIAWMDIPTRGNEPAPDLFAEVSYGGRLVRVEQPGRNRFDLVVRLPAPLRTGDTHEYGLILRIPAGQTMRPHYIFTPECQCTAFSLRVRFASDRLPGWVRRVQHETVRMFDAARPGADLVDLDEAGEVEVHFRNLTMYLGYGLQWEP